MMSMRAMLEGMTERVLEPRCRNEWLGFDGGVMTTLDLRTSDTYAKIVDGAAISDGSAKWSALFH